MTDSRSHTARRQVYVFAVVVVTIVGFYLRYRCLGCLGFRSDEDLTSLAVKALLEKGVPELPSGMIYLRFYLYQWIVAASVKVFGLSEFSMRLPSAIFGTALIPITYLAARRIFDERTGIIVATCIALSFSQVEMARMARMYAPFFLLFFVTAYAIYAAYYRNPDRVFDPWILPLAFLTLTFHQLGYSLAVLLLFAIPLGTSKARAMSLLLQAAIVGIAFVAIKTVQERFFNIARGPADSGDSGLLHALLQQISLPDLGLVSHVYSAYPVALLAAVTAIVLSAVVVLRVTSDNTPIYRLLVITAIALSGMHLFNLVAVTLVLMLISLKGGVREMRNPAWYVPAAVCLTLFIAWAAAIVSIGPPLLSDAAAGSTGLRKLLRLLVDYPNFRLFWSFVLERPLLALPLAVGTLWGIDRVARGRPEPRALFLVGGFWGILFANGILETKFEFFRYNLHLDPLFLMLVVAGLFAVPDLLEKVFKPIPGRFRTDAWRRIGVLAVALVAVAGVNPAAAFLTSARDYTETNLLYRLLGLHHYPDFKTPGEYVRQRLRDSDVVLVLAPREYWNYIGRVDYWLWDKDEESQTYDRDGRAHDLYLGVPVLHSEHEIKDVLADLDDGNAWIVYSTRRLARTSRISPDLKAYLMGLQDHVVYVGRDNETVVIRVPGGSDREIGSASQPNM